MILFKAEEILKIIKKDDQLAKGQNFEQQTYVFMMFVQIAPVEGQRELMKKGSYIIENVRLAA